MLYPWAAVQLGRAALKCFAGTRKRMAMTKHEQHKALWAAIVADPKRNDLKVQLADWLEEENIDRYLMLGLRWCVEKNKWPNYGMRAKQYWWGTVYYNKGDLTLRMVEGWNNTTKKHPDGSRQLMNLQSNSLQHLIRRVGQAAEWVEKNGRNR